MSSSIRKWGGITVLLAFLSVLVFLSAVEGFCPSNGNTRTLYVTTNNADNILSFDSNGLYLGPVLNTDSFPADVEIHKLRSMHSGPGGFLYVASAKGQYSKIVAVSGNGVLNNTLSENCTRDYKFTVVNQTADNPFLDHPYDFEFHPETGTLFVANQNSVTVTQYAMAKGEPGKYPEWTPVENNPTALGNAVDEFGSKVVIPANSGLFVSSWSSSYLLTSVRGITLSPLLPRALVNGTAGPGLFTRDSLTMGYYLLVCDVAADMVHVFDAETGEHLYGVDVPSPIQVRFPAHAFSTSNSVFDTSGNQIMKVEAPYVYVTSKDDGMAYFVHLTPRMNTMGTPYAGVNPYNARSHNRRTFSITRPVPNHAASGIVEHPTLNIVLVADRTGRRISSYASPLSIDYTTDKGPAPSVGTPLKSLPDQPEFLMYALLENQVNIPFCYELGPRGDLRYAALCAAGRLWFFFFMLVAVLVVVVALYAAWKMWRSPKPRRVLPQSISVDSIPLLSGHTASYGSSKKRG